jgi:hypothetical protein
MQAVYDVPAALAASAGPGSHATAARAKPPQPTHIFTQRLELILCEAFAPLDLLYPLVQLDHVWCWSGSGRLLVSPLPLLLCCLQRPCLLPCLVGVQRQQGTVVGGDSWPL